MQASNGGVGVARLTRTIAFLTALFVGIALPVADSAAAGTAAQLAASSARVLNDARTGATRFVGFDTPTGGAQNAAGFRQLNAEEAAMGHLQDHAALFGLRDVASEIQTTKHRVREGGRTMTRYRQVYRGVPVIGGELIVSQSALNQLSSISGRISPDLNLDATPTITPEQASAIALQAIAKAHHVPVAALKVNTPALSIYDARLISPHAAPVVLVWQMEVAATDLLPIRELVAIDARKGTVALHFNQVAHAKNRLTYDAGNNSATTLPGSLDCNEANPTCSGGITDAVYAHKYAGTTYDYYAGNFARNGIDGAGMTIISTVRYCEAGSPCPYANAFWNGTQMVYGQGYSVAEDVVGHELTHGVTEKESGLFYYYQSGAINESLSDIFGEFVQQSNATGTVTPATKWLLGEDMSNGAIRNMTNPTAFGQPDRMTSANYSTGTNDQGGVHTNSGISNKAAYLMTDGGTFNGKTVTALGKTKVAKIFYEVQTNLLTSGSDFLDLYGALYQACQNLVGSSGIVAADCQQVLNAVDAVEMNLQPVGGFNPEASVCGVGQSASDVFSDGMESGLGNWTLAGTATVASTPNVTKQAWFVDTSFAKSGTASLAGYGYGGYVGQTYQPYTIVDGTATMNSAITIPAGAYLRFDHSFDLESGYDFGVLEYAIGSGAWTQMPAPDSGQGYFGVVPSAFGNPLAGKFGFSDLSHGYGSSRFNLATLAGQPVKFRWHLGTDSGIESTGWSIDNVRIYTCQTSAPTSQSITFGAAPANLHVGDTGQLSATASSGLPVTYISTTPTICSVSGSTVSGIAAGSCTVVANQAGNASYSAAAQATQSFAVTTVTATATNLLQNAGFESGTSAWNEYSSGGFSLISTAGAIPTHAGSYYAWLGGYNSGTDYIEQSLSIPANTRTASLDFWYRIATSETSAAYAFDFLKVELYSTSGVKLATLASLSNLNASAAWVKSSPLDVVAYKGQTVRLRFTATMDVSNTTSFFIDDVTLATTSASKKQSITPILMLLLN